MENISFILNKLEDAIIVLDSDQKIVFQNSHSIDLFENNYTGQNITNLIRNPIVLEALENVYKNKETEIIDEMGVIDSELRTATARAYSEVDVIHVTKEDFEKKLAETDIIIRGVVAVLSDRLRQLQKRRVGQN